MAKLTQFLFILIFVASCSTPDNKAVEEVEQNLYPNLLFIFADDMRYDAIHALGNNDIYTPHLDELIKNGTAFTNAYIMGSDKGAVCMPSRAMLHTGKYLSNLVKGGHIIPEDHTLIGEQFQRYGFNVFGTGKWHNGEEAYHRSFSEGKNAFLGGMCDPWQVPLYDYDSTGKYDKIQRVSRNPFYNNSYRDYPAERLSGGKHATDVFANTTLDWIENYKGNQPFFAYCAYTAPHDPRSTLKKYHARYDSVDIELPDNFKTQHDFTIGVENIRDEKLAAWPRDPKEVKQHIRDYYAMITHLDEYVGKMVQLLKDKGIYNNTVIVFAADNGLALGQHGLMGKQSVYEHSNHVPLIFSGPGIPKGEKRELDLFLLDIYPTLCDMLNFDIPTSVQGTSFYPSFKQNDYKIRDGIATRYSKLNFALKKNNMKLMEFQNKDKERHTLLFDLSKDPLEQNNLANEAKHKDLIDQMRVEMKAYFYTYGDSVAVDKLAL